MGGIDVNIPKDPIGVKGTDGATKTSPSNPLDVQVQGDITVDAGSSDLATETTLAGLLAAFTSEDFASQTTVAAILSALGDQSTAAKQDSIIAELQDIEADVEAVNTTLGTPRQENGHGSNTTSPTYVQSAVRGRETIAGLSFDQSLTATQNHTTAWVDVKDIPLFVIDAEVEAGGAYSAVIEFTNAADPNTTPPAAGDITRALTTTIAGTSLGGLENPSFHIPAAMDWARISVTAITTNRVIIDTEAAYQDMGLPQIPIAASLDPSFRAIIAKSIGLGQQPDGDYVDSPADGQVFVDTTPLGVDGEFVSEWFDTDQWRSIELVIATDAESKPDGVIIEYTDDVQATTPVVRTQRLDEYGQFDVTNGSLVLYAPTELDGFRVRYKNNSDAQTSFFIAATLRVTAVESPRSRGGGVITSNPWRNLFKATFETHGTLPTGATPTFDKENRIVAANVIDSGWLNSTDFKDQLATIFFDCAGVRVFLLNATDSFGNNSPTTDFSTPSAVSFANAPIVVGAPFFNDYFRIIIINDSGTNCNKWGVRSKGGDTPPGPVYQSIDQPILSFFPAPLTQTVSKGQSPDGDFTPQQNQGRHAANSTTTPLAGDSGGSDHIFRGNWFQWQESHVGMQTEVRSDVSGTFIIDFSTQESPANGDETGVDFSITTPYDPNDGVGVFRRTTPVQSRWVRVRYINGLAAQASFALDTSFLTVATPDVVEPLSTAPDDSYLAGLEKSIEYAKDDAGVYGQVGRTGNSENVHLKGIDSGVEFDIAPLSNWGTKQVNVGTGSSVQLSGAPLSGRKTVAIKHNGANEGDVYIGPTSAVTVSNGFPLGQGETIELDLDSGAELWAISNITGGSTNVQTLDPSAVNTNNGALNPTNAFFSDDSHATLDDQGDSIVFDMSDLTLTLAEIQTVKIGFEGRKSPTSPATETVTYIDSVTVDAGNVGQVTTGTVTANADHFYYVSITRRNASAQVTSITDTMGFTSFELVEDITNPSDFRTTTYRATGTPSTDGTVTVNLSQTATNINVAVSRFSGVDLSAPIENSEGIIGDAAASYSDSIIGTEKGMLVVVAGCRQRAHTAGSGATEQFEISTGTGSNGARQALTTFTYPATGSQNYSGTFTGNAEHATIAISLKPGATAAPLVTLTYEVNAEGQGTTTLQQSLTTTTDSIFTADVTGDRAWSVADVDGTKLTITATTLGAADAEIDHVFLEITEATTGTTQRIAVLEVA